MNTIANSVRSSSSRAAETPERNWFVRYAWFVMALNLAVIVWGAYVRASGSGSGCGDSWPLCNGSVLPEFRRVATVVEYMHRFSSAVLVIAVLGLMAAAWKWFEPRSVVRNAATWAVLLTFTEGLFGAALVLLGHVAENQSPWRGLTLSLHLMNTLSLIAALASTAWFAQTEATNASSTEPSLRRLLRMSIGACVMVMLTCAAGGIAALADTLFPASSLQSGWSQDFSPGSHLFVKLRVIHPVVAVCAALVIVVLCTKLPNAASGKIRGLRSALVVLVAAQVCAGAINLAVLHPVWLQLLHLLLADLVWICTFLLTAELYVWWREQDTLHP